MAFSENGSRVRKDHAAPAISNLIFTHTGAIPISGATTINGFSATTT